MAIADTLPKILKVQTEKYGDKKVSMRKKYLGIWKEYTCEDVYEHVKWVSLGLISIGFMRGDNIAIVGDSDPQWYWAEYAAQAAGGAAIGIYVDVHSTELQYLVDHCDAKFIFVKGQEQVDNISEVKSQLSKLERIFYWVGTGLQHYDDPLLMSYEGLEDLGKKYEKEHPGLFEQNIQSGKGEDMAVICYTSGTTGTPPKGIAISHNQLIKNCDLWCQYDPWYDTDILVSCVAPVSALEQIQGMAGALVAAVEISFPEGPDTVDNDMREMGPHYLHRGAPFWEALVSLVRDNMNKSKYLKKALYNLFLPVGYKVADFGFQGKKLNLLWKSVWLLGNLLVFRPLRDKLGLSRVRSVYQGSSILSSECLRFFHAIGVNLKQVYALAESGLITMHRDSDIIAESVGVPVEEETIRISETGEILFRADRMSCGYYKNPEATKESIDDQGWLHTGDSGFFSEDGHLIILGRSEEILRLRSGELLAPETIEAKLRFSPYIKHALLIGGKERDFVSALICMGYENVGEWAEGNQITYTTFVDLSQKTQVYDLIQETIKQVNRHLPQAAKIVKFMNFHKELDADEGELTWNGKLRRSLMEERYKDMIDAIYEGKEEYLAEAEVKYRDGKTGMIRTGIQIRSL